MSKIELSAEEQAIISNAPPHVGIVVRVFLTSLEAVRESVADMRMFVAEVRGIRDELRAERVDDKAMRHEVQRHGGLLSTVLERLDEMREDHRETKDIQNQILGVLQELKTANGQIGSKPPLHVAASKRGRRSNPP